MTMAGSDLGRGAIQVARVPNATPCQPSPPAATNLDRGRAGQRELAKTIAAHRQGADHVDGAVGRPPSDRGSAGQSGRVNGGPGHPLGAGEGQVDARVGRLARSSRGGPPPAR
jgi:hypothetical protein